VAATIGRYGAPKALCGQKAEWSVCGGRIIALASPSDNDSQDADPGVRGKRAGERRDHHVRISAERLGELSGDGICLAAIAEVMNGEAGLGSGPSVTD
jgi:hypothetical protein